MTSFENKILCDMCGEQVYPDEGVGESGVGSDGYIHELCDGCMLHTRMNICGQCNGWSPVDRIDLEGNHKESRDCWRTEEAASQTREYEVISEIQVRRNKQTLKWTARNGLNSLAQEIHRWAVEKGFWDSERNAGEAIAPVHSGILVALEAYSKDNQQDTNVPFHSSVEVKLADATIKILDFAGAHKLDLDGALDAKMKFNETYLNL